MTTRRTPFEVIWCSLDPKPLPLNYRHEEETGLYYAGDYNLRGRTPNADVDVDVALPREIVSVVNKQYTYIWRSNCDRRFYVGLTSDVVGRLQQHNDGKVTFTKARGPLALVYWEGCLNRSDAAQHEKYLKSAPIPESETQEFSQGFTATSS